MVETADEPINHKALELKASIHCEGCKRKVKKILSQFPGVLSVAIDAKLQKVTALVSANVEADALIKKLVKSGKHAQLWPQKPERKEKNSGLGEKKVKPSDENQNSKVLDQSEKVEPIRCPASGSSVNKNGEKGGGAAKVNRASGGGSDTSGASEKDTSGGVRETESAQKVPAEKGGGMKNEKEGQNGNLTTGVQSSEAAAGGLGTPTNQSPPRHPSVSPPPVYSMSYNTAYPTSSYTDTASCSPSYSYAYTHPGWETEQLPSDPGSHGRQPLDSFEIFSDENPNGCTIA